ncbi:MAG: radical SAM protein [Anaerolineaceae bacterium]|nr:radical SAM protein [Anaerolineaceae bacterium]
MSAEGCLIHGSPSFHVSMANDPFLTAQLDEQGHLILPDEILQRYGIQAGTTLHLEQTERGFRLLRSPLSLARMYVEPTNVCNLDCRTCMRNVWDEALGSMTGQTFKRILQDIQSFTPRPTLFFGGFGEPLAHPDILEMVTAARQQGAGVEMITNGTLLTETVARRMVELGLNRLWVSLDGATPQSYTDVRLGDALPLVIANLTRLHELRSRSGFSLPKLGIAFVAMRRNLADLPAVIRLGKRLGADQFSISNVLPHTAELRDEVLYAHALSEGGSTPSPWSPEVALPRMDLDGPLLAVLEGVIRGRNLIQNARGPLGPGTNTCPFIVKGSLSIRWDGAVSPCLPLLHTHQSYLGDTLRTSLAYVVGNVLDRSLADIWSDAAYVGLRERLQAFDFSPCTFCNSCEMSASNREDCFGNVHPTCGGCLWAQGFIRCP